MRGERAVHAAHYTLYVVLWTAFLISFSGDLFYIPRELAFARKNNPDIQEETSDPQILKK
jgi:hypothetical protein